MIIGFIDDRQDNRAAWRLAMESILPQTDQICTFDSVQALLRQLEAGFRPRVMFVDFFIDGSCGSDAISLLRQHLGNSVFIIAHSSMDMVNQGLLRHGADMALSKIKGQSPSPTILSAFPNYETFCAKTQTSGT
jgi:hypothetical protein